MKQRLGAAPVLEFAEHVFDPVALAVERSVVGNMARGSMGYHSMKSGSCWSGRCWMFQNYAT